MLPAKVIGLMSGTSLDGLDIALCNFWFDKKWHFQIIHSETLNYSKEWKQKLQDAPVLSGFELTKLDKEFGSYIGNSVNDFINRNDLQADLIASHGHTVFHQPENSLTLQIGSGEEIAAKTRITTVSDFRSLDVALGGQGAPLVPIGDELLFSEYDYCINIGGFSNISFRENNQRIAFDICPANIILNHISQKEGYTFDENGKLGKPGNINGKLLTELNNIPYYQQTYPKSLGKEWLDHVFMPLVNKYEISNADLLRTIYEHIAIQISSVLKHNDTKALITGGGAFNTFLIDLIKEKSSSDIILPSKEIIDYKEALIFAFLGILRINKQVNCLSSVTGAKIDSSGGVVHFIQ